MFRPKLDHKYFTSETYWTKWNYLSKWDSNSMKSKDVVEDNILKNPTILESYTEGQFNNYEAEEVTAIIDCSKTVPKLWLFDNGNASVRTFNIILLNYDYDTMTVGNLTYMTRNINTINITAYDKNGNKVDKIKYTNYLPTEATEVVNINAPTLVFSGYQEAFFYHCLKLRTCPDLDLTNCIQFSRICDCGLPRLPFKNVGCNMYWGMVTSSTSGSLMPNVAEEEWARWFREDLKTVTETRLLKLGYNLSKLSDETKKIATDKGWTLA